MPDLIHEGEPIASKQKGEKWHHMDQAQQQRKYYEDTT
jgi:hypothetical protein